MKRYDYLSQAINHAVDAQKYGMLSDDARSLFQWPDGTYSACCQGCEPYGAKICGSVWRGKVYQDGIGGSPNHEKSRAT